MGFGIISCMVKLSVVRLVMPAVSRLLLVISFATVAVAVDPVPDELLRKFRTERQAAIESGAIRVMLAFPVERADQMARRGEQALQLGRTVDAVRSLREARWRLPPMLLEPIPNLSRILGSPRLKHGNWVSAVAWNADGSLVASAGRDSRVRVWDMQNGRLLRDYREHADWVKAVAFLPNGKVLSAAGKEIRIWEVTGNAEAKVMTSSTGHVKSLAVRPDGTQFVAGGDDRSVHVWDVETAKEAFTLGPFAGAVESVAWSAAGNLIAAVAGDGSLAVWDLDKERKKILDLRVTAGTAAYSVRFSPDGKSVAVCGEKFARIYAILAVGEKVEPAGTIRRTFEGGGAHGDMVTCVAYSPDGKILATGSREKNIMLWDTNTGLRLRTLLGHSERVNAIAFSPNGDQLASVSEDQSIRLWDLSPTVATTVFAGHRGPLWATAISPDGTRTASGGIDRTIRVWDTTTGKELRALTGHTGAITALAWSADGQRIISASGDKTVRAWEISTGQTRTMAESEGPVLALVIAPDGRRVAVAGADRKVRIVDLFNSPVANGASHNAAVSAIAWRPDGNVIASVSVDGIIKLWDVAENKEVATGRVHDSGGAASVAFLPDGQRLMTCGGDGQIKLWKVTTPFAKEPLLMLSGHSGPVSSINISADGKILASGGADTIVKVWDLDNRSELQSFRGHGEWVTDVAISRAGATVVSADAAGKVHVWSLETKSSDSITVGHSQKATAIAAGANSLATGSNDRGTIIWDLATGREPKLFPANSANVRAVALSPDASRLAVCTEDWRLRCLDANTGKELRLFELSEFRVSTLVIAPDNKNIVACQRRETNNDDDTSCVIARMNIDTGQSEELVSLKGRGVAQCVALNTDLTLVVLGSADGKLQLWRLTEKTKIGDDRNASVLSITAVALTPDNKSVISMDETGEARVWPIDGMPTEPVQKIKTGAMGDVQGLAVSPDGRRLLAFGSNREVAVFDISTGQLIRRWSLSQKPSAATFTTDARHVATANDDGTAYVLDLP